MNMGLTITTLGNLTIKNKGEKIIGFSTRKTKALLIFLAVENEANHRRESLFTLLWPGMPERSARRNLRQTLFTLRQIFPEIISKDGADFVPLFLSNRQTVQINPEASINIDVHYLNHALDLVRKHQHPHLASCRKCIQALEKAMDLFTGDFLSDFYLEDSNLFEDWIVSVREEFHRKGIEIISVLTDIAIENKNYYQARKLIEKQLLLDNLQESAIRRLMEVLVITGHRVEALNRYRQFSQLLNQELNIAPSKETNDLYKRIQNQSFSPRSLFAFEVTEKTSLPRNNLPYQPTSFVGRQRELTLLGEMLEDSETRLISIIGPGGIGKTRLAIAFAQHQLECSKSSGDHYPFPDGVFFVSLESIDSSGQISNEIARTLNLSFTKSETVDQNFYTIDQQLINFLIRKRMLLILDNFEHLMDGAQTILKIIQSAQNVRILVTSRLRLNLHGEQIVPIDGLTYPTLEFLEDPIRYSAIQLFVESACRIQPDFELKDEIINPLVTICKMLGGLPLGLELASSWVDLLSVQEIANEIQKNIGFLETDWVDLSERHHNLLTLCDTTWDLMKPGEQDLFKRLSVFRGGFTLEAAQEVALATIRDIRILVSKSIIQYDQKEKRYRIHPYLREFGEEKLGESLEEINNTFDVHCSYFSTQMEENIKEYESGQTQLAIDSIGIDIFNFKIAWDRAISRKKISMVSALVVGLCYYYEYSNRNPEAFSLCQDANHMLQEFDSISNTEQSRQVNMVKWLQAKVYVLTGWYNLPFYTEEANINFNKCSKIINELNESSIYTSALKAHLLCNQAFTLEDYPSAKKLWLKSISLARETQDVYRILICYFLLGAKAMSTGLFEEAKSWFGQGLILAEEEQNRSFEIRFLTRLGMANRRLGFYDLAHQYFEDAFFKAEFYGLQPEREDSIRWLSDMALFLGHLEKAGEYLEKEIAISDKYNFAVTDIRLSLLGVTQWLLGDFTNAEKSITTASNLFGNPQYTVNPLPFLCEIELLVLEGRYEAAKQLLRINDQWLKNIDYSYFKYVHARFLRSLGCLSLIEKNYLKAKENLEKSIVISKNQKDTEAVAWAEAFLSITELRLGNKRLSKNLLTNALSDSVEIQGYIPMVFCLPMTLFVLTEEDPELAKYVYQQCKTDPFLAKAQLLDDLVYSHLPDKITCIPEVKIKSGPMHRETLWATAKLIQEKWEER